MSCLVSANVSFSPIYIDSVPLVATHDMAPAYGWTSLVLAGLSTAAAIGYVGGVRRVTRQRLEHGWPRRNTWCFTWGILLCAGVTIGPIGAAATQLFSMHMVQHIVLMMIAGPLLVLGAPVMLLLRASAPSTRRKRIVPVLRSRGLAVVTNPVVTWVAFAAVLVGIHFSPVMGILMGWGVLGNVTEILLYLGVSFAYYYTLLPGNPARNRPSPALRVVSLFLIMIPETITGFFIYSSTAPLVPQFAMMGGAGAADLVLDQQFGGSLMWSTGMIIDVAWIAIAVSDWFNDDARKTRRLDQRIRAETRGGPLT